MHRLFQASPGFENRKHQSVCKNRSPSKLSATDQMIHSENREFNNSKAISNKTDSMKVININSTKYTNK